MKSFFLLKTHEINDYIFWYYICLKLIMTSKAISHVYIRYSINIIINGDLHELVNNRWHAQGISALFTSKLTDIFNKRLQGVKNNKNDWDYFSKASEKSKAKLFYSKKVDVNLFLYEFSINLWLIIPMFFEYFINQIIFTS